MRTVTRTKLSVILLIFLFVLSSVMTAQVVVADRTTTLETRVNAKDNFLVVRMDVMSDLAENYTFGNVTISMYNLTKAAYSYDNITFKSLIFEAFNRSVSALNGSISDILVTFNDANSTVSILFTIRGLIHKGIQRTYGNETRTYDNGFEFDMSWKNTFIAGIMTFNVTQESSSAIASWRPSQVFIFDRLNLYPMEKWNVTKNTLIMDVSPTNTSRIIGRIVLPPLARYISMKGEVVTFFVPEMYEANVVNYYGIAGTVLSLIGALLFVLTRSRSRIEKLRAKFEKREQKAKAKRKKKHKKKK